MKIILRTIARGRYEYIFPAVANGVALPGETILTLGHLVELHVLTRDNPIRWSLDLRGEGHRVELAPGGDDAADVAAFVERMAPGGGGGAAIPQWLTDAFAVVLRLGTDASRLQFRRAFFMDLWDVLISARIEAGNQRAAQAAIAVLEQQDEDDGDDDDGDGEDGDGGGDGDDDDGDGDHQQRRQPSRSGRSAQAIVAFRARARAPDASQRDRRVADALDRVVAAILAAADDAAPRTIIHLINSAALVVRAPAQSSVELEHFLGGGGDGDDLLTRLKEFAHQRRYAVAFSALHKEVQRVSRAAASDQPEPVADTVLEDEDEEDEQEDSDDVDEELQLRFLRSSNENWRALISRTCTADQADLRAFCRIYHAVNVAHLPRADVNRSSLEVAVINIRVFLRTYFF